MVAWPAYLPVGQAFPPSPITKVQQHAYPGADLGTFRSPYSPRTANEHQPVLQQNSIAVSGPPPYFDLRQASVPSSASDPLRAIQYADATLRLPPSYHLSAVSTFPTGFSGHRAFRRKRTSAVNDDAGPCLPPVGETLPILSQQRLPTLQAAHISRETYESYRRVEAELEATAQREKEIARFIQSVEAKANSGRRPPAGSLSAMMQSLADRTAHLARCFGAYTRKLTFAENDATGGVRDPNAMVEEIIRTPATTPSGSVCAAAGPEGRANGDDQTTVTGAINGATSGGERESTQGEGRNNLAMSLSLSPSQVTAVLAEDLMKLAINPPNEHQLGPPNAKCAPEGRVVPDARDNVGARPSDIRKGKPEALPFSLPEHPTFPQLALEPASAPARLIEQDLYFSLHH